MVERIVLIRLKPEVRGEAKTVAAHTQEVLGEAVGVRHVHTAVASDERTKKLWDLMISLRFDDLPAVERYRADPRHRKYLEVYLRPLLESIRAFNFDAIAGIEDG
ncbi:MAG: Dabb family protein [Myxococcota bacterium]